MKANETSPSTPCYVLLQGDGRPSGPRCSEDAEQACNAVYGFTSRAAYEAFCDGVVEPLRPYPLVCGYLTRVIDHAGIRLIVVDAPSPTEETLDAALAEERIAGKCDANGRTIAAYRLIRSDETAEYDVELRELHDAEATAAGG